MGELDKGEATTNSGAKETRSAANVARDEGIEEGGSDGCDSSRPFRGIEAWRVVIKVSERVSMDGHLLN